MPHSEPPVARVAVNGLGRIGRALLRLATSRGDFAVVAVNDLAPIEQLLPLVRRDSVHGHFPGTVERRDEALCWPVARCWSAASGSCRHPLARGATADRRRGDRHDEDARGGAARHLRAPVTHALMSANLADADLALPRHERRPRPRPVVAARDLERLVHHQLPRRAARWCSTARFGVDHALMNTVHCVTNSQNIVDNAHADPRRAAFGARQHHSDHLGRDPVDRPGDAGDARQGRGPGDARAGGGGLAGRSHREPRPRRPTRDAVADAFRAAERGPLAGILGTTDEELVSSDVIGDPRSAVVDLPLLSLAGDRLLRVVAWYDNEWGYTNRLAELLARLAR